MNRNAFIYIGLVLAAFAASMIIGLPRPQVLALGIFGSMLFGTLLFWRYRLAFAFLAVSALLVLGLTDIPHVIEFAGLDIVFFLVGMMILIGYLESHHFFDALLEAIVNRVGANGKKLILVLMLLAAFFAALVDEVTSTLFMMATLFQITSKYKLNPLPFLMMLVFATNVGSSATVVGNPVGIIIAMRAELSFTDFLRWATPISFVALILTILLCFLFFSKDIKSLSASMRSDIQSSDNTKGNLQSEGIFNRRLRHCWFLFIGTIVALILHAPLEHLLGLHKNTLLLAVSLAAGGVALMLERSKARELLERRVDWWTLCFFLLLFTSVGTLRYVGVTATMAKGIVAVSGQSGSIMFLSVTWASAILSSFMDNVLAVSTFIPVVKDLGSIGMDITPLWWGMLFGGTLGGNATMIGSTANIVAVGMMEIRGYGHISFKQWIKAGLFITVPTLALASMLLLIQLRP